MRDLWGEAHEYFMYLKYAREEADNKANTEAILDLLERLRNDRRFQQVRPRPHVMGLLLIAPTTTPRTVYIAFLRERSAYMLIYHFIAEVIPENTIFVDTTEILEVLSRFVNEDEVTRS